MTTPKKTTKPVKKTATTAKKTTKSVVSKDTRRPLTSPAKWLIDSINNK